jgi:hypothetical protein
MTWVIIMFGMAVILAGAAVLLSGQTSTMVEEPRCADRHPVTGLPCAETEQHYGEIHNDRYGNIWRGNGRDDLYRSCGDVGTNWEGRPWR